MPATIKDIEESLLTVAVAVFANVKLNTLAPALEPPILAITLLSLTTADEFVPICKLAVGVSVAIPIFPPVSYITELVRVVAELNFEIYPEEPERLALEPVEPRLPVPPVPPVAP